MSDAELLSKLVSAVNVALKDGAIHDFYRPGFKKLVAEYQQPSLPLKGDACPNV